MQKQRWKGLRIKRSFQLFRKDKINTSGRGSNWRFFAVCARGIKTNFRILRVEKFPSPSFKTWPNRLQKLHSLFIKLEDLHQQHQHWQSKRNIHWKLVSKSEHQIFYCLRDFLFSASDKLRGFHSEYFQFPRIVNRFQAAVPWLGFKHMSCY